MTDREEFEFDSHGTTCRAWFYPAQSEAMDGPGGVPAIVMAHGLGATRDCGLAAYADKFADAGMAVLVFDYRHFGASDGQPRQLLSIQKQLTDWACAIRAVRAIDGIDANRIALWGTALSGGHVMTVAAADRRITAVVAQAPMTDGWATTMSRLQQCGAWYSIRSVLACLRDYLADLMGADPHYLPVSAPAGQIAVLATDSAWEGYQSMAPDDWQNKISARSLFALARYRPGKKAGKIHCPVLVQICDDDRVTAVPATMATVDRGGEHFTERHYHIGHFDIFRDAGFRQASSDQVTFLQGILARRE